ncbi:MAG: Asp-tRNA(Asn)/Glu-tRNA(Gln) amidotransferase subunit GatC [Candidatus Omnitrophica bacterium]|nr:Asp-tRNA(Asn)/Glu-tRNA(Gln) amidotransferase subunit GatC [Candidatus Omnitrophota bacterium]
MKITVKDVQYVANLARLELTDEELGNLTKQLDGILTYMNKLNELDTEGIEPLSHVLPLKNVYREDKVTSSLPVEEALKNAPGREGGFFKVPKVIE